MADLGAIAYPYEAHVRGFDPNPMGAFVGIGPSAAPLAANGTISGTTTVEGVSHPGIHVYLFYRQTMLLVDHTVSDASGAFSFTGVSPDLSYVVLAKTPSGTYNDLVFRLT